MKSWMLLVLTLVTAPAFGRDPAILEAAGNVLGNSSTRAGQISQRGMNHVSMTWEVPHFRCPRRERMTVKVIASGGTFSNYSSTDIGRWLESELTRQVMSLAPARNITVFQGTPCPGDLVLEVTAKVLSGRDYSRSYGSNSRSDSWRWSRESTSSSSRDSREWTGTYLSLSPILKRVGQGNQWEVVAAPAGRISASDSEMTSASADRSYSSSESYRWRRGNSSSSRSEKDGYEWGNDEEMSREMQADGLVARLSRQTSSLVFQAWQQVLEADRYNENEDRAETRRAEPQTTKAPAKPAQDKPFRYTITNE